MSGLTESELAESLEQMLRDVLKSDVIVDLNDTQEHLIIKAKPEISDAEIVIEVEGEGDLWWIYFMDGDGKRRRIGSGKELVAVASIVLSSIASHAWVTATT